MLAPFILVCLLVIPGCPDTRARAGSAPKAQVVPIGYHESLLRRGRQCGPRRASGTGARRVLEDVQLVTEAAVGAAPGLNVYPTQEGLRANASDGTGEVVGAVVPERVVL